MPLLHLPRLSCTPSRRVPHSRPRSMGHQDYTVCRAGSRWPLRSPRCHGVGHSWDWQCARGTKAGNKRQWCKPSTTGDRPPSCHGRQFAPNADRPPPTAALNSRALRASKSYSFIFSNTVAWAKMPLPPGSHTPVLAFKSDCAAAGSQGRFADDSGEGTGVSEFDTGVRTGVHRRPKQVTHAKVIGSTR